jgi:hypothetical protein
MTEQKKLHLKLELIWWVFTIILAVGLTYPIQSKLSNYPFLITTVAFIIIFITFTRYVFLLKHTFLAKKQILKVVMVFLCLPVAWYLVEEINYFQTFIDEQGPLALVGELPDNQQKSMSNYIRSVLLFFGVGGVIITVVFALRLIVSVWRLRNRGSI